MVLHIVAFEGLDRAGKSTQVARALEALSSPGVLPPGWSVAHLRYPQRIGTATGPLIDAFLRGEADMPPNAASLVLAANMWEAVALLEKESKAQHTLVISDRYAWTSAAYSSARGMSLDQARAMTAGLPLPALVVYLRLAPEAAVLRAGYGAERYERVDFQRAVLSAMEHLAEEQSSITVAIDATLSPDAIAETIRTAILSRVIAPCT